MKSSGVPVAVQRGLDFAARSTRGASLADRADGLRLRANWRALRASREIRIRVRQANPLVAGSLPDFIVIGAQRAGTTSLHANLAEHPLLRPSIMKEIQYFSLHIARGIGWYRACFPSLRAGEKTFESSPFYIFDPAVPPRLRATLPQAKLVVVLRDPVDRAYSHYLHSRMLGHEELSFVDALDAEPSRLAAARAHDGAGAYYVQRAHSYFSRGLYADQIRHWFRYVDPSSVFIIRSEEMFSSPAKTYADLLGFLGIQSYLPSSFAHRNSHTDSSAPVLAASVRDELLRRYAGPNEDLRDLLGWSTVWPRS